MYIIIKCMCTRKLKLQTKMDVESEIGVILTNHYFNVKYSVYENLKKKENITQVINSNRVISCIVFKIYIY